MSYSRSNDSITRILGGLDRLESEIGEISSRLISAARRNGEEGFNAIDAAQAKLAEFKNELMGIRQDMTAVPENEKKAAAYIESIKDDISGLNKKMHLYSNAINSLIDSLNYQADKKQDADKKDAPDQGSKRESLAEFLIFNDQLGMLKQIAKPDDLEIIPRQSERNKIRVDGYDWKWNERKPVSEAELKDVLTLRARRGTPDHKSDEDLVAEKLLNGEIKQSDIDMIQKLQKNKKASTSADLKLDDLKNHKTSVEKRISTPNFKRDNPEIYAHNMNIIQEIMVEQTAILNKKPYWTADKIEKLVSLDTKIANAELDGKQKAGVIDDRDRQFYERVRKGEITPVQMRILLNTDINFLKDNMKKEVKSASELKETSTHLKVPQSATSALSSAKLNTRSGTASALGRLASSSASKIGAPVLTLDVQNELTAVLGKKKIAAASYQQIGLSSTPQQAQSQVQEMKRPPSQSIKAGGR